LNTKKKQTLTSYRRRHRSFFFIESPVENYLKILLRENSIAKRMQG